MVGDHFANSATVTQWGLHFTYFMSGGESSGLRVLLAEMCVCLCVSLCVYLCELGEFGLLNEILCAHCFPVKISVPNHPVTPLVFYPHVIFDFISLVGRRGNHLLTMLRDLYPKFHCPLKIKEFVFALV